MIENNTTTINSKQESLEDLLIIKGISKVYKKDNKEYKVLEDINFKININILFIILSIILVVIFSKYISYKRCPT